MVAINHAHSDVKFMQPMRAGQNRYRLVCGHYLDCACLHVIGSGAYCLACGTVRQVTTSAIYDTGHTITESQSI